MHFGKRFQVTEFSCWDVLYPLLVHSASFDVFLTSFLLCVHFPVEPGNVQSIFNRNFLIKSRKGVKYARDQSIRKVIPKRIENKFQ